MMKCEAKAGKCKKEAKFKQTIGKSTQYVCEKHLIDTLHNFGIKTKKIHEKKLKTIKIW